MTDYSLDKGLPASPEAERAILGAVILENNLAGDVISELQPEHFHLDAHRQIFGAMDSLLSAGKPIETLSLAQELGAKALKSVGGHSYLSGLTDGVPRRASIDHYISVVRKKAQRRQFIHCMNSALLRALEDSEETEEIADDVAQVLSSIEGEVGTDGAKHISEIMGRARLEMEHQAKQTGLLGMTTGIKCLDDSTTGIREGEVWIVGALPGRGKSAFSLQVAGANAQNKIPTLVLSLEMRDTQLARRLLANYSSIGATKLRVPSSMKHAEWVELGSTMSDIIEWPLYVDDASELTVQQLKARIRLYVRKYGIKLVIVDYLMLVSDPTEKETRIRASNIANAIRQVVKDEKISAVVLSQISRPAGKDINKRPTMLDLKESGDIEASAHVVLLLYMPMNEHGRPTGEDEIIIGKQREGTLGAEEVVYSKRQLKFVDRSEVKEQSK